MFSTAVDQSPACEEASAVLCGLILNFLSLHPDCSCVRQRELLILSAKILLFRGKTLLETKAHTLCTVHHWHFCCHPSGGQQRAAEKCA